MITAVVCKFRRTREAPWETGIAITTAPAAYDVIAIVPADAKTPADIPQNHVSVWDYQLWWHYGTLVLPQAELISNPPPCDCDDSEGSD